MKNKLSVFPPTPDARERLVDRIGSDFYALTQQLTTGLQGLLEVQGVAPAVREAVGAYVNSVVKDLMRVEAGVVRLANVPGCIRAGLRLSR